MLDPDSGRRQGLFQAAAMLASAHAFSAHERTEYEEVRRWFAENLEKPERLAVSSRPHAKAQAIGWFKDTSATHIANMRRFQHLLEAHDIAVSVLRTNRPGYVVYEDEFQVAAHPFANTPS